MYLSTSFSSSSSELEAALLYDRKSIVSNGLTAKTNFSYTKAEVEAILSEELCPDQDINNKDEISKGKSILWIQKISVVLPTLSRCILI